METLVNISVSVQRVTEGFAFLHGQIVIDKGERFRSGLCWVGLDTNQHKIL